MLSLPLVKLPGAEKLVRALQRHGEHFFGTPIVEHGVPIYTDARHYTSAGIPTVLYGAGPRTLAEANGHGQMNNCGWKICAARPRPSPLRSRNCSARKVSGLRTDATAASAPAIRARTAA